MTKAGFHHGKARARKNNLRRYAVAPCFSVAARNDSWVTALRPSHIRYAPTVCNPSFVLGQLLRILDRRAVQAARSTFSARICRSVARRCYAGDRASGIRRLQTKHPGSQDHIPGYDVATSWVYKVYCVCSGLPTPANQRPAPDRALSFGFK
jgi:hypothetical protein